MLSSRGGRSFALLAAALALAAALVYGPLRRAQFVYDDWWTIVRNPAIRSVSPVRFFTDRSTVAGPASGLATDIYRPLVTLSFALDYRIWGLSPGAWHVENLLLFFLNAALLWVLLRRLLGDSWTALAGAALFLFHPVQVQTVAWVTQRSNLLSGAGFLGALLCWTSGRTICGLLLYVLTLMCKETALILPLVLILIDALAPVQGRGLSRERLPLYAGVGALSLLYLAVRSRLLGQWSQFEGQARHWGSELALGATAFPVYIGKLLAPLGLRPSYGYPDPDPFRIAAGALALAAFIAGAWALRRRAPILALASAWIFIGLLPFLQIIPIRAFVAERFLYFSVMGLALGFGRLFGRYPRARWVMGLWLAWLSCITVLAVPQWMTEQRLWAYGIRQEPANAFAQACYAETLHDPIKAEEHYRLALMNRPAEAVRLAALVNLSRLALHGKRPQEARVWAETALRQDPASLPALYNLFQSFRALGRRRDAREVYLRVKSLLPEDAPMPLRLEEDLRK
ncbi:MAG: tetratricopeptide repeat protein [Elusimicrobia bacterium]|nr:tetratricopeptide repeat protein [Elusimicrobiota bacterium]